MKKLFASIFCVAIIIASYDNGIASPREASSCTAICIDKYTKEFNLCHGNLQCQDYMRHAGESCLRDCQTAK
jgi:hypothetical protein